RARALRVRATESPARCPARAFRRSFGEYAFLEDSRYASQEKNVRRQRGVLIVLSQLTYCPRSASLPGIARGKTRVTALTTPQPSLCGQSHCEECRTTRNRICPMSGALIAEVGLNPTCVVKPACDACGCAMLNQTHRRTAPRLRLSFVAFSRKSTLVCG